MPSGCPPIPPSDNRGIENRPIWMSRGNNDGKINAKPNNDAIPNDQQEKMKYVVI